MKLPFTCIEYNLYFPTIHSGTIFLTPYTTNFINFLKASGLKCNKIYYVVGKQATGTRSTPRSTAADTTEDRIIIVDIPRPQGTLLISSHPVAASTSHPRHSQPTTITASQLFQVQTWKCFQIAHLNHKYFMNSSLCWNLLICANFLFDILVH